MRDKNMADQQLIDYIKSSLTQGVTQDSLMQALTVSGWTQA